MKSVITVDKQFNLRPGIDLTAEQVAQLTSDMVWLVSQKVTLPDGTKQGLLVPQVYVRVQPGDLDGTGDASTRLTPIFDQQQVQNEVAAQITITGEFGKQAAKAVGDYAADQLKQAVFSAAVQHDAGVQAQNMGVGLIHGIEDT